MLSLYATTRGLNMTEAKDLQRGIAAKVMVRLALPTILFMLLSSLDRVNISFAALQMNKDLGFTPTQNVFAAGIFFLGFWRASFRACCCCSALVCAAGWHFVPSCGPAVPQGSPLSAHRRSFMSCVCCWVSQKADWLPVSFFI